MPLSPTGRVVHRRPPKHQLKYEAGLRSVASPHHINKQTKQIRSSHLGYDCYILGQSKIRCIFRAGRCPPHITNDVRLILPLEMYWPERIHAMAHGMIDAVMSFDLSSLRAWKASWPTHEFGYEHFIEVAQRRIGAVRDGAVPAVPRLPNRLDGTALPGQPTSVSLQGAALPRQFGLFPGTPISEERHGLVNHGAYKVRTYIIRFDDGLVAVRVDVGGVLVDGDTELCSSAYVDLADGRFEIIRHYPGRLRALNLPVRLIYSVLGVRAPKSQGRTEHRPERCPPIRSRPMAEGRAVGAIFATGNPTAGVAHNIVPEGKPQEPTEYVGKVETIEDGSPMERFPDAPRAPTT
jgi:hypothetical protein